MKEQLQNIKEQALNAIGECSDVKQLDELRVKYTHFFQYLILLFPHRVGYIIVANAS